MIRYAPYIDGTIPAFDSTRIIVPFTPNKAVGEGAAAGMVLRIKEMNGNNKDAVYIDATNTDIQNNIAYFNTSEIGLINALIEEFSFAVSTIDAEEISLGYFDFLGLSDEYTNMVKAVFGEKIYNLILYLNNKGLFPKAKSIEEIKTSGLDIYKKEGNNYIFSHIVKLILSIGQYYKVQLAYYDNTSYKKDTNGNYTTELDYSSLTYSSVGITKYIGDVSIAITETSVNEIKYNYTSDDSTEKLYDYSLDITEA